MVFGALFYRPNAHSVSQVKYIIRADLQLPDTVIPGTNNSESFTVYSNMNY